ncbi:MAG: 1-deoxy-D-xylulose-5-phosphate synthase [Nanoarchaeota archaeon]
MPGSNFLGMVNSPRDLRVLSYAQLRMLAQELRQRIIETCSKNGGHLAPSLGVVELTIALHHVFDSPRDKIVWDVGHQAYAHKLLTGRRDRFHTLRQHKGISGFPHRDESEHDAFGTGHSSTSISAALGIAKARDMAREHHHVIAVIGDGALTGGLALEGLNNAGHSKTDIIIVLNDNGMSISENVGAFSYYLQNIVTRPGYVTVRQGLQSLRKLPLGKEAVKAALGFEETVRAAFSQGMLFKQLGFNYFGPINGHNIGKLIHALRNCKHLHGPILLHVRTVKGKGYPFAEMDKTKFHGISQFQIENGEKLHCGGPMSYTDAFSASLISLAKDDPKIVAITAAMAPGTGLDKFAKLFPERFFDVGIAEQHAVTFAAGLATQGFRPVVAIYSTFLQRAFDQVIHDVALQKLPVTFAIDRAGIVGDDGATHQGQFDLAYLRLVPNLVLMAPMDENELAVMLKTALGHPGPAAVRFPRGCGQGFPLDKNPQPIAIGKAAMLRKGKDLAVICIGTCAADALHAAEATKSKVDCTVINARFVKPLDTESIIAAAKECGRVLTVEEGCLSGGFGSAVLEALQEAGLKVPVERIGIADQFVEHGSQDILRKSFHLDKEAIADAILAMGKGR